MEAVTINIKEPKPTDMFIVIKLCLFRCGSYDLVMLKKDAVLLRVNGIDLVGDTKELHDFITRKISEYISTANKTNGAPKTLIQKSDTVLLTNEAIAKIIAKKQPHANFEFFETTNDERQLYKYTVDMHRI